MKKPWLAFYEPQVPEHIDYPKISLYEMFARTAREYPDRPATIFATAAVGQLFSSVLTYGELATLVDRFAAALQRLGVKKGDRVGIFLPNCPQFVIAYYAIARIGGIVVPFNPLYAAREVEHQLNDSGAEVILVLSRFYPLIKQVRARTALRHVIVTNIKEYFPGFLKLLFTVARERKEGHRVSVEGDADTRWFQELLQPAQPAPVEVSSQDTAILLYTGGTTGVSKGAELTHYNQVCNAEMCQAWVNGRMGQEVVLAALPLFHTFGMTCCLNLGILGAASMVLTANPRDTKGILMAIQEHRPTLFPGVPMLYVSINNHPDVGKYDLKCIRACISGGAPLPVEVQQTFQRITGARLVEGFGLTETSPVTHSNPLSGDNRIGTIGLPFPDTLARVVDVETGKKDMRFEKGEEWTQTGELILQGPQVMRGYWNRPDETAQQLRDGWLFTGDIAQMHKDGYFRIVDRKKDMIIRGGFNIYPADIEEVLYEYPKVQEAMVVGIPDKLHGEIVKAYIVLKQGETTTEAEVLEYCRQHLAKYKIPSAVEVRAELPKSAVGKLLRRILRDEELAKQQAAK